MFYSPIPFQPIPWGIALAAALVAAVWDIRTQRIPNVLTMPLMAVGIIYVCVTGGLTGLWHGFEGCLVLGVPYVILFVFAGGGAGDAKLLGAMGMLLGVPASVVVLVGVVLAGGVLSLIYVLARGRLRSTLVNLRMMLFGVGIWAINGGKLEDAQVMIPEKEKMLAMPYGLAIFTGSLAAAGWVLLWK